MPLLLGLGVLQPLKSTVMTSADLWATRNLSFHLFKNTQLATLTQGLCFFSIIDLAPCYVGYRVG